MFLWPFSDLLSDMVHTGNENPQDGLRDMQTCGITLASAYMLHHLSAMWLQFPIEGRKKFRMGVSTN